MYHNEVKKENLKSALLLKEAKMPITDATKKQIAQQRRLFFKICFKCGAKNHIAAERCRKCHSSALRLKNRTLGAKK
jgi:ubiquitin-large subunit ribosomal protein L40e